MGIGELAARAGTTPRTVRYYVAERLLPPPVGGGRRSVYGYEHLVRLGAIRALKADYLPLAEIRRRLAAMSLEEIEALVVSPDGPERALDAVGRPLGAVHGLPRGGARAVSLGGARGDLTTKQDGKPDGHTYVASATSPTAAASGRPAGDGSDGGRAAEARAPGPRHVGRPEEDRPELGAERRTDRDRAAGERAARPAARAVVDAAFQLPDAARSLPRGSASSVPIAPAAEGLWRRVVLAPGVELSFQPSDDPDRERAIAELVEEATRRLAATDPPAGP